MTDFDLDRLGDVWRQQPDPEEMARLQRTAAAVAQRARLSSIMDILAAVAVALVVIFFVVSNPRGLTVIMGAAAIMILLGSNIRLRKLRQVELKGLTGNTEDMLDQSIERIETTVRHNRFSLIGLGPCILVGYLFASTSPGGSTLFPILREEQALRMLWIGISLAVIAGIYVFLAFTFRRAKRELGRLRAMRESYREERESTAM